MKSSIFSKFRDFVNIKQPFSSTNYRLSGGFLGGIKYLLFDDFLTPLAAGSVDGTNAEPTGGARDVTDTDGIITISSGEAQIGTIVTPAWGNHYITWPSVALSRAAGQTLIAKFTIFNDNIYDMQIGWSASPVSSGLVAHGFWSSYNVLYTYNDGTTNPFGSIDDSVTGDHYVAVLLRAAGAFV